jgi:purine-nucleoside phosphorylase
MAFFGKYSVQTVLSSRFFRTKTSILRVHSKRRRAQEVEMEVAALVIFGSVALWFAEELHGNTL